MRKKLITFLLASSSSALFADVNLYGRVAAGVENDQFQNTTIPRALSVQDFGSYFGIRGSDQVYGETSAIWQVEQFLDITSGQSYYITTASGAIVPNPNGGAASANNGHVISEINTLASSESYLGLNGAWGRFRIGNLSNYMRSSMGAIDTFNYNNGVDGLGVWSRSSRLLPTSIRYDSSSWNGFSFVAEYSFQSNGIIGVSGVNGSNNFGGGLNGNYSSGITSAGITWAHNNISVKLGTMITEQVGSYSTGSGIVEPAGSQSAYQNAYINRLELSYEDPDGLVVSGGLQVSSGQGWFGWANSGGSFDNYITNPGYNVQGLNTSQYQTQELAASLGWHLGPWTPKLGYVYGNNMMYGGDVWSVTTGSANQIANSGYQQLVAELDWNITPKTIVFINAGEIWYGSTLQNVSYCGTSCSTAGTTVSGNNQAFFDQASTAIGFTHTF